VLSFARQMRTCGPGVQYEDLSSISSLSFVDAGMPVFVRQSEEGEMVCFEDFIGDDMIAIVVGVFELHHVASGEVGGRNGHRPVLAEGPVHRGLGGYQEPVAGFQWVHDMSKRLDSIFIRERSLFDGKLTFDTVRQHRTVRLESLSLKGDFVHDDTLLEVDFVVGFEGAVILESGHSLLGVTLGHGFLEEVDQTVGKVGETLEPVSESVGKHSPGHGQFPTRAHPFALAFSIGRISETFTFDDERLTVDGPLNHGVEGKFLTEACCTGGHLWFDKYSVIRESRIAESEAVMQQSAAKLAEMVKR